MVVFFKLYMAWLTCTIYFDSGFRLLSCVPWAIATLYGAICTTFHHSRDRQEEAVITHYGVKNTSNHTQTVTTTTIDTPSIVFYQI